MNALVQIDRILSPETIAAPADILTPAVVFAPGGVEAIISKLEAEVRATDRDMTTDAGREAIKSLAYNVARSKTALDEMGKELVADIKKQSGAIDAERRVIRERLDALRDEVRRPLTAWEAAETDRVDGHERAIVFLIESPRNFPTPPTVSEIRARIAAVADICSRQWDEFHERAEAAATEANAALNVMLTAAIQAEADAAELAELRKLKAERDERDAMEAFQKAQDERMRREADEKAAADAERAEQEKARDIARAEQAARDAEAAAAKAVEDERQRVANAKAAEEAATAKREANKRHRTKVHVEIFADLIAAGLPNSAELAERIVAAIDAGSIRHVSITY